MCIYVWNVYVCVYVLFMNMCIHLCVHTCIHVCVYVWCVYFYIQMCVGQEGCRKINEQVRNNTT